MQGYTIHTWNTYSEYLYVNLIWRVSCWKGPTRHAYAWQIGPFWQDTLDIKEVHDGLPWGRILIQYTILMHTNYIKCKYIVLFVQNNSSTEWEISSFGYFIL